MGGQNQGENKAEIGLQIAITPVAGRWRWEAQMLREADSVGGTRVDSLGDGLADSPCEAAQIGVAVLASQAGRPLGDDVTPQTCPWCKQPPEVESWDGGPKRKRVVHCINDDCPVQPMVTGSSRQVAIALWNQREDKNQ